jgi:hypothetical protein
VTVIAGSLRLLGVEKWRSSTPTTENVLQGLRTTCF